MGGPRVTRLLRLPLAALVGVVLMLAAVPGLPATGAERTLRQLGLETAAANVVMTGAAADDGGIAGELRIRSNHAGSTITVYATDLTWVDADPAAKPPARIAARCSGDACIPAARLTLDPAEAELAQGVWTTLKIVGPPVPRAGLYAGTLQIQSRRTGSTTPAASAASPGPAAGPPQGDARIRLLARVRDTTAMEPLGALSDVSARRTHINGWLDGVLAAVLLPEAERTSVVYLTVNNPGSDPIVVTDGEVSALGERTNRALESDATVTSASNASVLPPFVVRPTVSVPLAVRLNMANIESDKYRGAVYLGLADRAAPQTVNLDLTIRDGPSIAFVLLILGAAFGWLSKWLTEKGERIVAAKDRLDALRARAADSLDGPDVTGLSQAFKDAAADIDANELDEATARLNRIDSAIRLLLELKQIEPRIPPAKAAEVRHLRDLAYLLEVDEASKRLTALRGDLEPAIAPTGTPAPPPRGGPSRLVLGLGVTVVAVSLVLVIGSLGPLGLTPGASPTVPVPSASATPALPVAGGVPQTDRSATADRNQLIVTILVLIAAVLLWRLPWFLGRLRDERFGAIRLTRVVIQAATFIVLLGVGLRLLYVDEGAEVIRAYVDPIYQFMIWGFGVGFGTRTIGALLK